MTEVAIKAEINLAGFPEGEVRLVERTSLVDAMLARGLVSLAPSPAAAPSKAPAAPVEASDPAPGPPVPPAPPKGAGKASEPPPEG